MALVDEVYKLLPSDRFPRKIQVASKRPRSSIEMQLMKDSKNNISIPQSECTKGAFDCVKSSMGMEPDKKGIFPDPASILKDWCPDKKIIKNLIPISRTEGISSWNRDNSLQFANIGAPWITVLFLR